MTLDELIEELQRLRKEHGNATVVIIETETEMLHLDEVDACKGYLFLKSRGA